MPSTVSPQLNAPKAHTPTRCQLPNVDSVFEGTAFAVARGRTFAIMLSRLQPQIVDHMLRADLTANASRLERPPLLPPSTHSTHLHIVDVGARCLPVEYHLLRRAARLQLNCDPLRRREGCPTHVASSLPPIAQPVRRRCIACDHLHGSEVTRCRCTGWPVGREQPLLSLMFMWLQLCLTLLMLLLQRQRREVLSCTFLPRSLRRTAVRLLQPVVVRGALLLQHSVHQPLLTVQWQCCV
mmetsp:Transcript_43428/g.98125  ORF Transcript_43428/g.98125 Transcript_43428/m.98125 type:complete len:239 (-) Transcript_43428:94-810(-)